jgi:hypothetical protein
MAPDLDQDAVDPQDTAETEDETHLNEDADEFTTLEEAPDVYDVTSRDDDDDDVTALDEAEFTDEDAALDEIEDSDDSDELEDTPDEFQPEVEWAEATESETGALEASIDDALEGDEIEGLDEVGDADTVEGGEDDFTNFQSKRLDDAQLQELGYEDPPSQRSGSGSSGD